MSQNLLKDKLYVDYPLLFTKETSFYLPEGWYSLVDGLCDIIANHVEYTYPEELRSQISVSQVKEKFGSLRFYMKHDDSFIEGAITMAEHESYKLCQRCGTNDGKLRNIGGWVSTLCEPHFEEAMKEK